MYAVQGLYYDRPKRLHYCYTTSALLGAQIDFCYHYIPHFRRRILKYLHQHESLILRSVIHSTSVDFPTNFTRWWFEFFPGKYYFGSERISMSEVIRHLSCKPFQMNLVAWLCKVEGRSHLSWLCVIQFHSSTFVKTAIYGSYFLQSTKCTG